MSELLVVRHGQASLFAADYDVLSELGHAQATALGTAWHQRGFCPGEFVTGPARRQRDTAQNVCQALRVDPDGVTTLEGFDEHDAFAMMKTALPALSRSDPNIARLQERFQQETDLARRSGAFQLVFEAIMQRWLRGEVDPGAARTWADFRQAVQEAVAEILARDAARGRKVAVFTSVGPIAVMLMGALNTSPEDAFRTAFRVRNASVSRFLFGRGGTLTLEGFNETSHLAADALTHR